MPQTPLTEEDYRRLAEDATARADEAEHRASSYRIDVQPLWTEHQGIALAITAAVHKLDLSTIESLQRRSAALALVIPHTSAIYKELATKAAALQRSASAAEWNHRVSKENAAHAAATAGNKGPFGNW